MELLKPMLSDDPATAIKKLDLPDWFAQQKMDGVRLLIHCDDGKVIPVNRNGDVIDLPSCLVEAFSTIKSGQFAFDGEFVGGVLWLFDLPIAGEAVHPSHPYEHRFTVLEQFYAGWDPGDNVKLVPTARTVDDKQALKHLLKSRNAEGMILKNKTGKYLQGPDRSSDSLKLKFWESCEVIITELGREGKENAVMTMIDPDLGKPVEVGTVSRLGKKNSLVEVGSICEIKYLYAVNPSNPHLVQPSIQRIRNDKPMHECVVGQIKYTNKRVVPLEETGL